MNGSGDNNVPIPDRACCMTISVQCHCGLLVHLNRSAVYRSKSDELLFKTFATAYVDVAVCGLAVFGTNWVQVNLLNTWCRCVDYEARTSCNGVREGTEG